MIKTDRQRADTLKSIAAFRDALDRMQNAPQPVGVDDEMHAATLRAQRGFIEKLAKQVADYDALKRGGVERVRVESLEDVPEALIKLRIAKGWTQKALAQALRVAPQQVQRWESRNYENAGFDWLLEIGEVLRFDLADAMRGVRPSSAGARTVSQKQYAHATAPALPPLVTDATSLAQLLPILQKANTFNQTSVVEYSLLAGEKHKKLKEARRAGLDAENIRPFYVALVAYLNDAFTLTTRHNVSFLRRSFVGRPGPPPRICVKGNLHKQNADTILPLFRERAVNYVSDVAVSGNTGFAEIARTGTYYLQNDIPAATLRGAYLNPRLDLDGIRTTYGDFSEEKARALSKRWPRHWKDHRHDSDPSAYYRSTLIMPLKLWDGQISGPFEQLLEQRHIGKIFGYLCLDHPEENYFAPAIDLNVAKIFADALCAMVLLRLNFTIYSRTFMEIRKALPQAKEWDREAASGAPWALAPAASEVVLSGLPQLETTPRQQLFSVSEDASLLTFVRVRSAPTP